MKDVFRKAALLAIACLVAVTPAGCGSKSDRKHGGDYQPRYSTEYDADVDSWRQVDPEDGSVSINWYFDYTIGNENLEDLIFQRTGVNVRFYSVSDMQELNSMIAGDTLPDVLTVSDSSLRIMLAEEGYCLPLNKLAEYYAPSMLKRVTADHWSQYAGSDGNTYALASNFYSDEDIAAMEELGAHQYAARDIIVRKDMLDAYIAAMTAADPSFNPDTTITRPSGFRAMCNWVKTKYGKTVADPTVVFAPFNLNGDELSYSLTALYEMFGFAPENASGDLNNFYTSAAFKEALKFMNALYCDKLVSSQNFQWDAGKIGREVQNGNPFAVIGGSQLTHYQQSHREMKGAELYAAAADKSAITDADGDFIPDDYQYVSILLTDEDGNAPLLHSYAGKGVYQTVITTNCKREDRVIKVFDYLLSELGQRECMYGNAENYTFEVRPGEIDPVTGKTSKYGILSTTDALRNKLPTMAQIKAQTLGIRRTSAFVNAAYGRMVSREDDFIGIRDPVDWMLYGNKTTYYGYTYNQGDFDFTFDGVDRRTLNAYARQESDIFDVWSEAVPELIKATTDTTFENIYKAAIANSEDAGMAEWQAVRNECFKRYKAARNMTFAYPKNRPDYQAQAVRLQGGLYSPIDRPQYVYGEVRDEGR